MPDTHDEDETLRDGMGAEDDLGGEGGGGMGDESRPTPATATMLKDAHGYLGAGLDMLHHHGGQVESEHGISHMDAMSGTLKDMMAKTAELHNEKYPDEEPLEGPDEMEAKSGMGGDYDESGETDEIGEGEEKRLDEDDLKRKKAAAAKTRKGVTRAVPGVSRKSGRGSVPYDPTDRTLARLNAEADKLERQLAGE